MNKLPQMHVGSPIPSGPLTLFPVWTDTPSAHRCYRLGMPPEGSIAEMPGDPRVDALTAYNGGHRAALLLEGSLLSGGWRHRVLTRDVLIPASSRACLPVACVEQGRWGGAHDQAASSMTAPLAVRGALRGVRLGGGQRGTAQGDVWRRVDRYQHRFGRSETGSLVDVQRRVGSRVAPIVGAVRPLPGQRGVLIGLGGHPVLLEVFDSSTSLAQRWASLLAGVVLDAIGTRYAPVPAYRARAFVRRVQSLELSRDGGASGATDLSGKDDLASVRSLRIQHRTVHLSALNVRHDLVLAA